MTLCAESAKHDASMIAASAQGWDLSIFAPSLWHVKGKVPTWYGAGVFASKLGIKITSQDIKVTTLPRLMMNANQIPCKQYTALVGITDGRIIGAGLSLDPKWGREIAIGLAFRTAVEKSLQLGGKN